MVQPQENCGSCGYRLRPGARHRCRVSGQHISQYLLKDRLDESGLGEVWSAEDPVQHRTVNLKFLSKEAIASEEHWAQLQREAHLLSGLSHPHISGLYGLEEVESERFLVLEPVPGETLDRRIASGLAVPDALGLAAQLARGLAAAHDMGILHRGLKPASIKVTPAGEAKVLDFGLSPTPVTEGASKGVQGEEGGSSDWRGYMSPEQLSGSGPVDRRSDIWSFGCVLYEMLAGRPAYDASDISGTATLREVQAPDWSRLPGNTPPRLRTVLQRCLESDPERRLHDVNDARLEIEEALIHREWMPEVLSTLEGGAGSRRSPWLLAAALGGVTLAGGAIGLGGQAVWGESTKSAARSAESVAVQFDVKTPQGLREAMWPTISPDGGHVAFSAQDPAIADRKRNRAAVVRDLTATDSRVVPESWGLVGPHMTFSPDSRWLAFIAGAPEPSAKAFIYKWPLDGSTDPIRLVECPESFSMGFVSMAWLRDEEILILIGGRNSEKRHLVTPSLQRIPTDGSAPPELEPIVPVPGWSGDPSLSFLGKRVDFAGIVSLHDGRHLLAMSETHTAEDEWSVTPVAIDTETMQAWRIIRDPQVLHWPLLMAENHVLYTRRYSGMKKRWDQVMAAPIDPGGLTAVEGTAVMLDGRRLSLGSGPKLAANGTLVSLHIRSSEGEPTHSFIGLFDREGQAEPWPTSYAGKPCNVTRMSGDGSTFACESMDPDTLSREVWVGRVGGGDLERVGQIPGENCTTGFLSWDGALMSATCRPDVGPKPEDGAWLFTTDGRRQPEQLAAQNPDFLAVSQAIFSRDGSRALYAGVTPERQWHYFWGSVTDPGTEPIAVPELEGLAITRADAPFSRDGRWLTYVRVVAGTPQVFLRAVGENLSFGPEIQVTTAGGPHSDWGRVDERGRQELIYRDGWNRNARSSWNGSWKGIWVDPETGPAPGAPHDVMEWMHGQFAALPDGRVLATVTVSSETGLPAQPSDKITAVVVVLNWPSRLREELAVAADADEDS